MTPQGREYWQHRRSQLRWRWWLCLGIAIIGAAFFVRSFPIRDPYAFAVLLLIPLIALRQAYRADRQIALCDKQLAAPMIDSKENNNV
jgi:hypothetical protein